MSFVSANNSGRWQALIPLSLYALVGAVVLALSTPRGLGLSPDSAVYVGAARSLMHGHGYSLPAEDGAFAPISHYPPLYSMVLAGSGYFGLDPLTGGRWINVFCLAAIVFLSGLIIWQASESIFWSALAAMMILTGYPIVLVHTMAWSEPLFLLLQLAGAFWLLCALRQPGYLNLIAAASTLGIAVTVRYAGFAAVLGGMASLLWVSTQPPRQKYRDTLVFLSVSVTPIGIWLFRNYLLAGSGVNRRVAFHPLGTEQLHAALNILVGWYSALWQSALELQMYSLVVSFAGIIVCWSFDRKESKPADDTARVKTGQVALVSSCLVVSYLLMLFVTISLLDFQTPLDSRILSPFFLFMVLLGASAGCYWLHRPRLFDVSTAVAPLAVFLVASQLTRCLPWLETVRDRGVGYNSRVWSESALLLQLSKADPASRIFSNAPDVIYALLNRPSGMIPRKIHPDTRAPNSEFAAQLGKLKQPIDGRPSFVVMFNAIHWRWYLPTTAELESLLGLQPVIRTDDGVIYQIS